MSFFRKRKKYSHKPKRRKKDRGIRLILLIIFFTIVLGVVVRGAMSIRNMLFVSNDHVGIVFHTSPVLFLFFDRNDDQIIAISIPEDTYVELTRGFGSYRLGASWKLGEIEGLSGQILLESVQELLGVPIDKWVSFGSESFVLSTKTIEHGLEDIKTLISPWSLDGKFLNIANQSSLSMVDTFLFSWTMLRTPVEDIYTFDLLESEVLQELELADGSIVLGVDRDRLDVLLSEQFEYETIRKEQLSVEVLNATNRSFLGQNAARLITNSGARVVRVSNADIKQDECTIKAQKEILTLKTFIVVQKMFDCIAIELEENRDMEDIQVVIGNDYAEKLFGSIDK